MRMHMHAARCSGLEAGSLRVITELHGRMDDVTNYRASGDLLLRGRDAESFACSVHCYRDNALFDAENSFDDDERSIVARCFNDLPSETNFSNARLKRRTLEGKCVLPVVIAWMASSMDQWSGRRDSDRMNRFYELWQSKQTRDTVFAKPVKEWGFCEREKNCYFCNGRLLTPWITISSCTRCRSWGLDLKEKVNCKHIKFQIRF